MTRITCFLAALLHWLGAAPGQAQQVGLNHIYVYLDSASYQAVAGSSFVRDSFATTREGTITDTQGSWSGLYLFGRETYLELYRAGPTTPPPGTVAFAFGVDRPGDLARIEAQLRAGGRHPIRVTRRRPVDRDTIPWFHQLSPGPADSAAIGPVVRWWVMEYADGYLARRPPGDSSLRGRIDRQSYNRSLFRPSLAVRDLVGFVVRLPEPARAEFAAQLEAIGWQRQARAEPLRLTSGSLTVDLESVGEGIPGLAAIRFETAPGHPPGVRQLGGAQLALEGRAATLRLAAGDGGGSNPNCPLRYRRIQVGARQVATCFGGSAGPLVIFESGLGEGMTAWASVLEPVSQFTRVLAYDRAGIGGSDASGRPRTAAAVADELAELLAAAGESGPVILVGHSLGGMFARAFHLAAPDRVLGLVLVDPTPEGFAARQREVMGPERYATSARRIESQLAGVARAEWQAIAANETHLAASTPLRTRGVMLSAGKIQNPDPIVGPKMKAIWIELHRSIAERLGLRHEVVARAGHYIQADSAGRVVDAVRSVAGR